MTKEEEHADAGENYREEDKNIGAHRRSHVEVKEIYRASKVGR